MRRALELERVDPKRCVQVGTRNFNFPSSKAFIDKVGLTEIPASRVFSDGVPAALATIDRVTSGADRLFVAVDVDVLDPAHAPGVGWHEPGGLTTRQLLDFLVALAPRRRVVVQRGQPDDGCPIADLDPCRQPDLSGGGGIGTLIRAEEPRRLGRRRPIP